MKKLRKWAELLYSKKTPKNIYIGLVGGVGDLVLASPSIAALKKNTQMQSYVLVLVVEFFMK